MTVHTLTIETLGICTHFTHGTVSGVPHRVVLPNATQIRAHTLALPRQSSVLYYLIPHFPQLEAPNGPELSIPGILSRGDVLIGARLQVMNCIDQEIEYGTPAPKLTYFYPDYTFSGDVVMQGRAALYLDIYGGRVSYHPSRREGGAGFVTIEMHTDGLPVLLVTPLAPWNGRKAASYPVTLAAPANPALPIALTVKNVELKWEKPADELVGAFDYLLHYLTARGGIPESIARPTPGMPPNPPTVTSERLSSALRELSVVVAIAGDRAVSRPMVNYEDLTPSCAPSQYP